MIFLFLLLLFFFEADRLVFFAMNHGNVPFTWDAFVDTWWHGLPLDVSTACYLLIPSWIITGIGIWVRIRHIKAIDRTIAAIISTVLALVWVADACLYGFWGIKLDGTVFNYLDSPQGALSSVSAGYMAGVIVAFAATVARLSPLLACHAGPHGPYQRPQAESPDHCGMGLSWRIVVPRYTWGSGEKYGQRGTRLLF